MSEAYSYLLNNLGDTCNRFFYLNPFLPKSIQDNYDVMLVLWGQLFQEAVDKHFPKQGEYQVALENASSDLRVHGAYACDDAQSFVFVGAISCYLELHKKDLVKDKKNKLFDLRQLLLDTLIHEVSHAHLHSKWPLVFGFDKPLIKWFVDVLFPAYAITTFVLILAAVVRSFHDEPLSLLGFMGIASALAIVLIGFAVYTAFLCKTTLGKATTTGEEIAYMLCYHERKARRDSRRMLDLQEWQRSIDIVFMKKRTEKIGFLKKNSL